MAPCQSCSGCCAPLTPEQGAEALTGYEIVLELIIGQLELDQEAVICHEVLCRSYVLVRVSMHQSSVWDSGVAVCSGGL
jgi:hypothetical protein